MRILYLALSLLPSLAVVALAWFVVRAISVRVVWRQGEVRRVNDSRV
jgi:hypothetical protein